MTAALEVHPMSEASPDLEPPAMKAMRESIAEHGQLVPILLSGNKILDGRKRYAACLALGKEPWTVDLAPGADPAAHAEALNLCRTHYTIGQRAMYAEHLANLAANETRRRPRRNSHTSSARSLVTTQDAGALVGVHASRVMEARYVRRHAIPEVTHAVAGGLLRLNTARKLTRLSPEDQARVLPKAIEAKARGVHLPPGTLKPIPAFRSGPKKPAPEVLARSVSQIRNFCDIIADYMDRSLKGVDATALLMEIEVSLRVLRAFRARLKGEES